MGTKKGCIYDKGAPFKGAPQRFEGGSLEQLDPPLNANHQHNYMRLKLYACLQIKCHPVNPSNVQLF